MSQGPYFTSCTIPNVDFHLNQQKQKRWSTPRMSVNYNFTRFSFEVQPLVHDEVIDEEIEEEEFVNDVSEMLLDDRADGIDDEEEEEEFANDRSESILDDRVDNINEDEEKEEEEEQEKCMNDISEPILDDGLDEEIIEEEEEEEEEELVYDISERIFRIIEEEAKGEFAYDICDRFFRIIEVEEEFTNDISESIFDNSLDNDIVEEEEEEEEEEFVNDIDESILDKTNDGLTDEFVDRDMFDQYLQTRTYYARVAMDIDLNEGDVVEEKEACGICLLEYKDGDSIGTLKCGHEYHVECINKWLVRKKTCPFCRDSLLPTHYS